MGWGKSPVYECSRDHINSKEKHISYSWMLEQVIRIITFLFTLPEQLKNIA